MKQLTIVNDLGKDVIEVPKSNPLFQEYKDQVVKGEEKEFSIFSDGALLNQG